MRGAPRRAFTGRAARSPYDLQRPTGLPAKEMRPPPPSPAAALPDGVPRPLQRTGPPDAAETGPEFPLRPAGDASKVI